jgi:RNA polymerase sigma-70 factor (ECF subfamily)
MLFEQYAVKMMTVCLRYAGDSKEAEDILQESFIRIFSYINQFRFEGSLEGWLKRIVVNTALRLLQRKKLRFLEIDDEQETPPFVDPHVLDELSAEELLRLISRLPEGYRIVFNLHAIEGYDHNEIAAMLNISSGTSRSQLAKARRLLQTQIKELLKLPNGYVQQ